MLAAQAHLAVVNQASTIIIVTCKDVTAAGDHSRAVAEPAFIYVVATAAGVTAVAHQV